MWADPRHPDALSQTLDEAPQARWVQLPFAGIENFIHLIDHDRVWTCGKGVYAEPVAELALTLALAGMRGSARTPGRRSGPVRRAATSAGPGSRSSAAAVSPSRWCGCCSRSTATSRSCAATSRTSTVSTMCWSPTATPTRSGRGSGGLRAGAHPRDRGHHLGRRAGVDGGPRVAVNVARGRHVVTEDLVEALAQRRIGGAGSTSPTRSRSRRPSPVDDAQLPDHATRREHARDGGPVAVRADHAPTCGCSPVRGVDRARRRRRRVLTVASRRVDRPRRRHAGRPPRR